MEFELMKLDLGGYMLHHANPAITRLVCNMSYRAFQCKLQNIIACKYFALYIEYLCIFCIQAWHQLIVLTISFILNDDIPSWYLNTRQEAKTVSYCLCCLSFCCLQVELWLTFFAVSLVAIFVYSYVQDKFVILHRRDIHFIVPELLLYRYLD